VWQNAELMQIVKQLNSEGDVLLGDEAGCLDSTSWPDHDTTLFPLVDSELDNYWNSFDPFEGVTAAEQEDRCRETGTPPGRQALNSPSSVPLPLPQQQQQQQAVYSSDTKQPREYIANPVLLDCCSGEDAEQLPAERCPRSSTDKVIDNNTAATRLSYQSSVVDGVSVATSSVDIPLGILSSLPPNCDVYITHRPTSTSGQKSSPSVTQIIINHALPISTLPPAPPPNTLHYRPSCCTPSSLRSPTLLLGPRIPLPPPTTLNHFHPLDEVRLRGPTPNVSLCCNKAPLTTVVGPPKSLSTYIAEYRHLCDARTWRYETSRRASDYVPAATTGSMFVGANSRQDDVAIRCRHFSSSASNSLMSLPISNNLQRPTSLSMSPPAALPAAVRPQRREVLSCAAGSRSLPSSWQRRSVDSVAHSPSTSVTSQIPDDETDDSLNGGVSRSCLGDSTADSCNSADSGMDGAACLLSNAMHQFCASSASSSPSSLVEGSDNLSDLPSPALSTASTKPHQRTIDALSKKIQRNQTQKSNKPTQSSSKDTLVSTFTKPDSSCPTPPPSRQLASPSFSSSPSLSPADTDDLSAISRYSKSCQHKAVSEIESADVSNSGNDKSDLATTNDANRSVAGKDLVSPSKRKRTAGRRKSQSSRQLSANGVEKVTIAICVIFVFCYCRLSLQNTTKYNKAYFFTCAL